MATPDLILPNITQAISAIQKRVQYVDQRSQEVRPIFIAELSASHSGDALTTTPVVMISVSVEVPDGYASVLVSANASAQAKNSRGVADVLRVKPNIAGVDGWFPYRYVPAGTIDSVSEAQNHIVTGLLDDGAPTAIVVQCLSWVDGAAWSVDGNNSFAVRAAFWFMR
jgi:hypothetical protein